MVKMLYTLINSLSHCAQIEHSREQPGTESIDNIIVIKQTSVLYSLCKDTRAAREKHGDSR